MAEHKIDEAFLHRLPKTDLHCHLDGSLRLSTIIDEAQRRGVELPATNEEELRRAIHLGETCDDLVDYLKAFDVTLSVLQDADALERAAYELGVDCAAENVRWLEVRYAPVLHQQKGLKLTAIVEAVLAGLRAAEREAGIRSGVIICGMRNISPAVSLTLAELAVAYKNQGVLGFDLAGAEHNYPAKDHVRAFQLILNNNVNCTAHAGEAFGPESIHQAIHYCGAHRIGHGTRLREDGDLLNYVADHRIPLEVCLSSNVQTRAVPRLAAHPLPFYLHYGLRVTLNTDNRLITDTTVTKELLLAHEELGLDIEDIRNIVISGFKSAFLPFHQRKAMLREAMAELDEVCKGFCD
ncbi:MAG: adenosine deaminase [Deltaproteobacteria bacterium]|nr:adenosine deaminase [Deltaproteobacteria bacterium]